MNPDFDFRSFVGGFFFACTILMIVLWAFRGKGRYGTDFPPIKHPAPMPRCKKPRPDRPKPDTPPPSINKMREERGFPPLP